MSHWYFSLLLAAPVGLLSQTLCSQFSASHHPIHVWLLSSEGCWPLVKHSFCMSHSTIMGKNISTTYSLPLKIFWLNLWDLQYLSSYLTELNFPIPVWPVHFFTGPQSCHSHLLPHLHLGCPLLIQTPGIFQGPGWVSPTAFSLSGPTHHHWLSIFITRTAHKVCITEQEVFIFYSPILSPKHMADSIVCIHKGLPFD